VNPIGRGLKSARVDMGVDYTGHGPLYAMGSGTIVNVKNAGWPGGTFIGLHLDTGQYMYYAENIIPHVHKGQRVQAGQLVGTAVGTYPFVEVGWAAPPGTGQTLAAAKGQAATGGDPGEFPTAYGKNMSDLIRSLGGPPGIISGPVKGGIPANSDLPNAGDVSTTGATMPGCVPLIYYVWVVFIASRSAYYRFRRHPAKCGYSVPADKAYN
jgi:peptidase M23-like protein